MDFQPNLLLGDRGPCWILLGAQAKEEGTFLSRCPTTIQPLQGSVTESLIPSLKHSAGPEESKKIREGFTVEVT